MKNKDFTRQLGEFFESFLPNIKRAKSNTISSYADSFAIFFEFIYEQQKKSHTNLSYKDFTPQLLDEYLLWLRNTKGYTDSSIHPRFSALISFLKYASRRNMSALHAYSAAIGAEMPKTARTEFPYFSLDEMKILLRLPNPNKYLGDRDLVLLSFLYETAARAQEVCDVCVKDIRFGSPTKVKLTGKGGKSREIPVASDVADLLRYHLKKHGLNNPERKSESLFSSQTNKKMTPACIRSIVAKYVKQAKTENPNFFEQKNIHPIASVTAKRFIWRNLEPQLYISEIFSVTPLLVLRKYMLASGKPPLQRH